MEFSEIQSGWTDVFSSNPPSSLYSSLPLRYVPFEMMQALRPREEPSKCLLTFDVVSYSFHADPLNICW